MTIASDATIEFFGTADTISSSPSAISDGAMSAVADTVEWTNDDDAIDVTMLLKWQYPSGTIDGHVYAHIRPIEVDGTNDCPAPTTTDQVNRVGLFEIATAQAATTDTYYICTLSLMPWSTKTSQKYQIFLFNSTGVTISASWVLKIIPKTVGPHA